MNEKDFINKCKNVIYSYVYGMINDTNTSFNFDDIYVVWCCKTLQNNKALLSTNICDGRYYECTFNGDKQELYFDVYIKEFNQCIK